MNRKYRVGVKPKKSGGKVVGVVMCTLAVIGVLAGVVAWDMQKDHPVSAQASRVILDD